MSSRRAAAHRFLAPIAADRRAVTAVECALIAALIAVVGVSAIVSLGRNAGGTISAEAAAL